TTGVEGTAGDDMQTTNIVGTEIGAGGLDDMGGAGGGMGQSGGADAILGTDETTT
ncbi:MAG: hypothetical protein ICV65_19780, partial [Flavisolibacter sp.]|nr:hypothetical protein [Flavisolibacter sp.]